MVKNMKDKIVNIFNKFFKTLASCVAPIVPVLVGVGMLKVVLIILGPNVLNILQETNNTYIVLMFVADAGYYFLPIYLAVSSAEYFHTNKYIAGLMGGMLLSPKFVELVNEGTSLSIFNLPIASINYANEILPSIIIVFIESYVYKFIDKHIYEKIRDIFTPLITIVIMTPIIYCAIGPLGTMLSKLLTEIILLLASLGPIGVGIYAALLPFVVMFGLGGTNLAIILSINAQGPDPITFYSNVIYNCVLGFVAFACYAKYKKSDSLAAGVTSFFGGTSEPALFGVALKDSKALFSTILGSFVGGLIMGIFKVKTFAVASFGVLGVIASIGPDSSIFFASIALIAACITAFVCYYLTHSNNKQ